MTRGGGFHGAPPSDCIFTRCPVNIPTAAADKIAVADMIGVADTSALGASLDRRKSGNPTCLHHRKIARSATPRRAGRARSLWVPARGRMPAPCQKRRTEARARPGHERVAADAVKLKRAVKRCAARVLSIFTMSNSAVSSFPPRVAAPGLLNFLFAPSSRPTPAEGWAERREANSLNWSRGKRDATLARRGPSRATGRPPLGAPPWRVGPVPPFRPPGIAAGPARRPLAARLSCLAAVAGLSSAVTSRGRRHTPLRLQNRLRRRPSMSGICDS